MCALKSGESGRKDRTPLNFVSLVHPQLGVKVLLTIQIIEVHLSTLNCSLVQEQIVTACEGLRALRFAFRK